MKTVLSCLVVLVVCAPPAFAEQLYLEGGPGLFKSLNSEIALLRYRKETSKLFNRPSFYETFVAHWTGTERDDAIGFSRGVSLNPGKNQRLTPTFGLLGVRRKTAHLGSQLQFYFRVAYEVRIKDVSLALAAIHISNGKAIFGWDGPNSGENFITLSVGLF